MDADPRGLLDPDWIARLTGALRLLAVERGGNAERVESWVRDVLRGPRREEALRIVEPAWEDPDPVVRRRIRRLSSEAFIEEAGRRLDQPPDPFAEGRLRMVREQFLPHGISDPRVVRAMLDVPREAFVPPSERDRAYMPHPLSIGKGQTISQPYIVAYMTEALALRGPERVLEIGTGSGYQAAILARIARAVYTLEVRRELADRAGEALDRLGCANVRRRAGDGHAGWPEEAPFDAVIVTCAPVEVPPRLAEQLVEGGRLVIPLGVSPEDQHLVRFTRHGGRLLRETLLAVRFVPMTGGE